MRRAIFLTAYDRPEYLEQALRSWGRVRGKERWSWFASIEPGVHADKILRMCAKFFNANHLDVTISVNAERLGVLHHPWVRFEELFGHGFDFVVRTEDDLCVSADALEYFEWASAVCADDPGVGTIHGFQRDGDPELPRVFHVEPRFDPLLWGTWADRWCDVIGPTWDHDYSTNNGIPGVQSGWDWNLNKRIYPKHGLGGLFPAASRVDNIGVHGTHSTPENFYTSASFRDDHGEDLYRLPANRAAVDIT